MGYPAETIDGQTVTIVNKYEGPDGPGSFLYEADTGLLYKAAIDAMKLVLVPDQVGVVGALGAGSETRPKAEESNLEERLAESIERNADILNKLGAEPDTIDGYELRAPEVKAVLDELVDEGLITEEEAEGLIVVEDVIPEAENVSDGTEPELVEAVEGFAVEELAQAAARADVEAGGGVENGVAGAQAIVDALAADELAEESFVRRSDEPVYAKQGNDTFLGSQDEADEAEDDPEYDEAA